MTWTDFFSELLWLLIIAIALDHLFLDGLFTKAIAARIRGTKK